MNKHLSANLQLGKTLREKKLSHKPILGAKSPSSCFAWKPKYHRKPQPQQGLCTCVSYFQSRACSCSVLAVHEQICIHFPCGHSFHAVSNCTTSHPGEFVSKLPVASQDALFLACRAEQERHCEFRPSHRGAQNWQSNMVHLLKRKCYFAFSYVRF